MGRLRRQCQPQFCGKRRADERKPSVTSIDLSNGGSGWDGIDNVPVMETVNGTTYAYVLYDGYSSYGGQLAKINCSAATPYVVWRKQVSAAAGFQLSTPYLDTTNRAIYIGASNASVYNNVAISSPVALTAGTADTVTIGGLSLLTAANRVSVPVYVGHTSVADRGTSPPKALRLSSWAAARQST